MSKKLRQMWNDFIKCEKGVTNVKKYTVTNVKLMVLHIYIRNAKWLVLHLHV